MFRLVLFYFHVAVLVCDFCVVCIGGFRGFLYVIGLIV